MTGQIVDTENAPRSAEDFQRARRVVMNRLVTAIPVGGTTKDGARPPDIELFMEFTTIKDALEIAIAVATARERTRLDVPQGQIPDR